MELVISLLFGVYFQCVFNKTEYFSGEKQQENPEDTDSRGLLLQKLLSLLHKLVKQSSSILHPFVIALTNYFCMIFIFKDHLHIFNLIYSWAIFNFLESAALLDVCRWVEGFFSVFFFSFSSMTKHKRISFSTCVYIHHSEIAFSAICRVVEALPLPFPYKTAVTHAFFLHNSISRLQLFNNLLRLGLFFFN